MQATATKTAMQSFSKIVSSAEAICNDKTQYFPEAASVGEYWRQGDIYVTLLESIPANAQRVDNPSAQLAPGTTQGSRHILDSLNDVDIYVLKDATVLQGPVLDVKQANTITHPEHGNLVMPPGCYGITYQRAFAEDLRRLQD